MSNLHKDTFLSGVNLGGWLVLEKWMTPSLFEGTGAEDEYTFMQTAGAHDKITRHRDTFITEKDFAWLSDHGVNAVRIPVGYWLLKSEVPFAAGAHYLDLAFEMAEKYKIKVLLDIHAHPGSQNGHDHSGRIGPVLWQKSRIFRLQSLDYLRGFAERYKNHPALWGVQVINEPNAGAFQFALRWYYIRAYRVLHRILPRHVKIVYSDAWSPRIFTFALLGRRQAVMDIHQYHMATLKATSHSLDWYYKKLARRVKTFIFLSRIRPSIIGEWSGVVSGESLQGLTQKQAETEEKRHLQYQLSAYKALTGTFYWSYKLEGTDGMNFWDYRSLVESKVI